MAIGIQVTFDAADPAALGRFWAGLLGYQMQPPPPGYDDWPAALRAFGYAEDELDKAYAIVDPGGAGPRIYLQRVPEGKTAKNRVHLDVNVGAGLTGDERRAKVDAEAERALALGATVEQRLEEHGEYTVVMHDPEGNEFCLQ
ncbi:MAG: VOC family protein [Streptosporangiales bacterium]|nr:VOC family protein [Streptosporangiales bacterium]